MADRHTRVRGEACDLGVLFLRLGNLPGDDEAPGSKLMRR